MINSRITARIERKYMLYSVIEIPVLAVLMMSIHFLAGGMYFEPRKLLILQLMYVMASSVLTCAAALVVFRRNRAKDDAIEIKTLYIGYNDRFFDYCLKRCDKIRSDRQRAMAQICVCQYYADAKQYDKALELLKGIRLIPLKDRERAAYYCILSYVLFISGDEEGAFAALSADPPLMAKIMRKKRRYRNLRLGIMYVNALQCTDSTPPAELITEIDEIKNKATDSPLVSEASIMLSLLSLKSAELAKAKEYISEAKRYYSTYGQNKRMKARKEIIEECYGIKPQNDEDSKQED